MKTTPTQFSERIVSLDVLRGIAVLGILIMNIQSFSMIMSAYLNPLSYGNLEGVNKLIWSASHLFADLKFMTLFSILFGAGIILFTDRLKKKGNTFLVDSLQKNLLVADIWSVPCLFAMVWRYSGCVCD